MKLSRRSLRRRCGGEVDHCTSLCYKIMIMIMIMIMMMTMIMIMTMTMHKLVLQDVDLNLIRPFQGLWIPSTDPEGSNQVIKDSNKPENEN